MTRKQVAAYLALGALAQFTVTEIARAWFQRKAGRDG